MRLPIAIKRVTNKRYEQLKKQYQDHLSSETLRKYKILREAFDIGKKLKGTNYTYVTLSIDFEIPYSTCKRILSLRKANSITWKLINEKKISAFKAAMILQQKNITYQDELIELVIENNLSTYDLKNLKDGSLKEVNDNKLTTAIQKGFSRRYGAYSSFKMYLNRVNAMTLIDIDNLPENKLPDLKKELGKTSKNIDKFINKLKK